MAVEFPFCEMLLSCCGSVTMKGDACNICYESIHAKTPKIEEMLCSHSLGHFHLKCIREWMETNTECPICKVDFELKNDTKWKKWVRHTKRTLRNIDYDEYDEVVLRAALHAAKDERNKVLSSQRDLIKIHDLHIDIIANALEKKITDLAACRHPINSTHKRQ